MERLSTLMDGELDPQEAEIEFGRVKADPALREGWDTYHLIGDVLRGQPVFGADVSRRVGSRLVDEPTVLAPRSRERRAISRVALSIAASVCGIAVVAWLAIYNNPFVRDSDVRVAQQQTVVAPDADAVHLAAAPEPAPASSNVNDYLLAHQEFSPSTAMQGMVSYVRTVSARDVAR